LASIRIASLSPAVTEILFALGIGKQIVCTDQFSNFPEEAKAIPHVQDHVKVNLEELQQYKPEAIFTSTVIQQALATMMKTAGLPSIHQDPRTIEAIYETIREIGMIVDREPQAKELIARMHKGFQEVKKKAKVMREGRDVRIARLYIEEWPAVAHTTGASHFALGASRDRMVGKHDLPYASGNWVPEIARIAGGEQFPVAPGALSPEVTLEEVERWNPALIVISWCGAGTLAQKELLLNRPGWDRLRAVQLGQVKVIDDSLFNRPGPRLVEGAQRLYGWMFEILH